MKQTWEYQTLRVSNLELGSPEVKKALSDAGLEGWELVTVVNDRAGGSAMYYLMLKRPK